MQVKQEQLLTHLQQDIFRIISEESDRLGLDSYVIGGFVRDIFLNRESKDIDVVTVGSGIDLATAVALRLGKGAHLTVFGNFGTAQVKYNDTEVEFEGARKESYSHDSRKPIVENGTLSDDQNRRDFTINALALQLNAAHFGLLIDPFNGLEDMNKRIIRTPLDPDITFSDDPLRMMRAIRFATQLNFEIEPGTFKAIQRNRERIAIISGERIIDEINKMMKTPHPSRGFLLLEESGLLELIFPELQAMKGIESKDGKGHKDNFYHTLEVLDNVAALSDNLWLRWGALLHDIGKPVTKRYDKKLGWTFHNHNFIGEKMIPEIFRKMKLPLNEKMRYVQKMVGLHMRPIVLAEEEVTDSAIRRLLFDAGDDIDDLMTLCEADITSKNREKVKRFQANFRLVRQKLNEIEEKDRIRNMQPPISGVEIMEIFNLTPCALIGELKSALKDAILDGIISNNREEAMLLLLQIAKEKGLEPVNKALISSTDSVIDNNQAGKEQE